MCLARVYITFVPAGAWPNQCAERRTATIPVGAGNIVENFSYTYDVPSTGLRTATCSPAPTYDALNRVTRALVSQSTVPVLTKSFLYDAPSTA